MKRIEIFDKLAENEIKNIQEQANLKRQKIKASIEEEKILYKKEVMKSEEWIVDNNEDLDAMLDEAYLS